MLNLNDENLIIDGKNWREAKNLLATIELLESYCGDIILTSYGFAPNPKGFGYEVLNNYKVVSKEVQKNLDILLNSLTNEEEEVIKGLYLK